MGILQRCGRGALLLVAAAAGVAGCDDATPPPTVIVNTPPADGGPMVLVTVMIAAAFVLAVIAVVCAWGWASERRAHRETERMCRDAEETVIALTGQPLHGARLLFRPSHHVPGAPATGQPGTDRQLTRWPE
jgi:hypothetical protein